MDDLNEKILRAMREQNGRETEEVALNPLQLFIRGFGVSTFRWVAPILVGFTVIAGAVAIYCGWNMLNTSLAADKIDWAVGCILAFLVLITVRIIIIFEINRLSVLREIKRVELQLAVVAEAFQEKNSG